MTVTAGSVVVRTTIAVPTFRRPAGLLILLPQLLGQAEALTSGGRYAVEVLVVDNDPETSAAASVRAVGSPLLRYVSEPSPGIAAVRNRALDESGAARLLVMIDDDEVPRPGWLEHLVATWAESRPAAVAGRVVAAYEGELDPWIAAGGFFVRRSLPTGSEVGTAAAGNLLLDVVQVRRARVRFATDLGLGGGEDTLFSRALVRSGGRIVWCDESVAVDHVPTGRMTRRWVLTRAWSHGNAAVLTELRLAGSRGQRVRVRFRGLADGVVRVAGGGLRWCGGLVSASHRHQARGLRTALRGSGMIGAVLGVTYVEYARPGERRLRWSRHAYPAAAS